MSNRYVVNLIASVMLVGCTSTRQIAIDYPSSQNNNDPQTVQSTQLHQFQPLSGFEVIDGDDYYVRLISEFNFKGDNVLKAGCNNMTPSYEKGDLSSSLVFSIRNEVLKFNNEVPGFVYKASSGKCNFKFDAKKTILTPWIRLDSGKATDVDYSFISTANSDVDVSGLTNDVTAASNLLALTGVGAGVAVVGQFAGQLAKTTPLSTATKTTVKNSSESHSLPPLVDFSGKTGVLNQTLFKVYAVAEGGVNIFGADTQPLGELKIFPELISSLLLKSLANGVPDARDLTFDEISYSPIKSAAGEVKLLQLIEDSKHPAKPNLKPDWVNYNEVDNNCRKIKLVLKDLGFNKFDRNAFLYYFLMNSTDWKNYNISPQKVQGSEISTKVMAGYQAKNFGSCLATEDYAVMKSMGLSVNSPVDWQQMESTSQKKEQFLSPLKSIERQLILFLNNPNKVEMEQQLYPLLATTKNGDGTVLLQNHLGDFGLEKLLAAPGIEQVTTTPVINSSTVAGSASGTIPVAAPSSVPAIVPASSVPITIPGEGLIVTARQLVQVITGLAFNEFSCARLMPDQQGQSVASVGFVLFTTKPNSPRAKGGAIEFEFSAGKINRIAFQLPTYRDFEQGVLDHPVSGDCQIDPSFISKLH